MKTSLTMAVTFAAVLFLASQAKATPWTPDALGGNLAVWLDGQDNSTFTLTNVLGVSRVNEWRDKSGNGNHVASAGSQRPALLATGGVNGKQSLAFEGSAQFLSKTGGLTGTPTGNSAYTMLVVYQYDSSLGTHHSVNGYLASFGHTANHQIVAIDVLTPRFVHFFNDHAISPAPALTDGNAHFYVDRYQPGAPGLNSLFFDGAAYGTANIVTPLNLGGNTLGINAFGVSGLGMSVHIGEVLIISDALGLDDRQILEGYIAHKWFGAGALNNLPGDHPFKNTAPLIPEPSSLASCALGLALLAVRKRRPRVE